MSHWIIKAYSKEKMKLITELKNLAFSKGISSVKDIFFAPLENNELGIYNSKYNYIALSDNLLNAQNDIIYNIFLHELAHCIQYKNLGYTSHDAEFRRICETLSIDPDYKKAKINIQEKSKTADKVKKLLALSSSPETEEAQSALKKAQELMAKTDIVISNEEIIYETCAYKGKTIPTVIKNLVTMARIISGGYVLITRAEKNLKALNFYGTHEMVDVFTYLYDYFAYQVEQDYQQFLKSKKLKGNSTLRINYYSGVAQSIDNRFNKVKENSNCKALVTLNDKIEDITINILFSNSKIQKRRVSYSYNENAYKEGKIKGEKINIRRGIKENSEETLYLK